MPKKSLICAFAILFSIAAQAQLTVDETTPTQINLNQQKCADAYVIDPPIQWILNGNVGDQYRSSLRLYKTNELEARGGELVCRDYQEATQNDPELGYEVKAFQDDFDESYGRLQPYIVTEAPSVFFSELADEDYNTLCEAGTDEQVLICVYFADQSDLNLLSTEGFGLTINIDTDAPATPIVDAVNSRGTGFDIIIDDNESGDTVSALLLECDVSDDEDAGSNDDLSVEEDGLLFEFPEFDTSECEDHGPARLIQFDDAQTLKFNNLKQKDYLVALWRIDDADNMSEVSDYIPARPSQGTSYLELLDEGDIKETSINCDGCDCGTAEPILLLPLMLLLSPIYRRRKQSTSNGRTPHSIGTLFGALLLILTAIPAEAEVGQKSFAVLGGPYLPALDESKGSPQIGDQGLYECLYHNENMFNLNVRGGYAFWHHPKIGHLEGQFGLGFGQTAFMALKNEHPSLPEDWTLNDGCPTDAAREDVGEEQTLTILTLSPGLSFTLDPLLDRLNIPLVPFVRASFDALNYNFTRDGSFDTEGSRHKPAGLLFGYTYAAGLHFSLDWLQNPKRPEHQYNEIEDRFGKDRYGLEHLYLTAEWVNTTIDNFSDEGFNFSRRYLRDGSVQNWSFNIGLTAELW